VAMLLAIGIACLAVPALITAVALPLRLRSSPIRSR